jgi:hypothetical protein
MERLDMNHLNSFCEVAWVFEFFFQMMLSDRSVCMIPDQGIKLAFLHPTSKDG